MDFQPTQNGYIVKNQFSDLIDGLLQGHQLGLQLRRQQQEDQAFKTNQALQEQQRSIQDIMNEQAMMKIARPVVNGMVTEDAPAGPEVQSGVPGTLPTQAPGFPGYVRAAKNPRTIKDSRGESRQWELKSPEQQQQEQLAAKVNEGNTLADAQQRHQEESAAAKRRSDLRLTPGGGIPAKGFTALGIPDGTLLTSQEFRDTTMQELARKKAAVSERDPEKSYYDLSGNPGAAAAPGAATAPGGTPPTDPALGRLITPGVKKAAGDYQQNWEPSWALKHGLTVDGLRKNADLSLQSQQEYAQKSKDPETVRLAQALTQAHLDNLAEQRAQRNAPVVPITPGTRDFRTAQDLAYGKLTFPQFRAMLSGRGTEASNVRLDIYNKAGELNPNFNPAQFEMGFKFAANPKTQQQLSSMDNVLNGVDDLLKFSDAASRSGATILNKFVQKGGIALGGKHYSDFHTAQIAFADELSGALGFGGATDMSKQMGIDMTNPNLSPENFKSAVENVVVPFIQRKKKSLLDQMGVYGQSGMNPAASPAIATPAAAAPAGATIRYTSGGKTYNIPASEEAEFLKDHPGAKK